MRHTSHLADTSQTVKYLRPQVHHRPDDRCASRDAEANVASSVSCGVSTDLAGQDGAGGGSRCRTCPLHSQHARVSPRAARVRESHYPLLTPNAFFYIYTHEARAHTFDLQVTSFVPLRVSPSVLFSVHLPSFSLVGHPSVYLIIHCLLHPLFHFVMHSVPLPCSPSSTPMRSQVRRDPAVCASERLVLVRCHARRRDRVAHEDAVSLTVMHENDYCLLAFVLAVAPIESMVRKGLGSARCARACVIPPSFIGWL